MKQNKQSQKTEVAMLLRNYGYITNFYSINRRLSIRLGAIIHELRSEGWDIETFKNGFEQVEHAKPTELKNCYYIMSNKIIRKNNKAKVVIKDYEQLP